MKRGAIMDVHLSRSESQEWHECDSSSVDMLKAFKVQANSKGRKFLRVFDNVGDEVAFHEVGR